MRRTGLSMSLLIATLALPSLALAGARPSVMGAQPKPAPMPAWTPPVPQVSTTAGGTQVIVLPRSEVPLVHIAVLVRAGAESDPPTRAGLSAAVATMLQEGGAGKLGGPELAQAFAALGDELQQRPTRDGVVLGLTVQTRNLDKALALLGDLLVRPRFDAAEWTRARARIVSELTRHRDEPRDIVEVVSARALYGDDHPYGRPLRGTPESIGAITIEELRSFYGKSYGPKTVTFLLAGDVAPAEATRLVGAALSGWTSAALPPPPPATAKPGPGRLVLVDKPGAPQSEVRVGHIAIARASSDFPSAQVIQMVLGGSFTSRLVQNLREKHGYTYGVSARYMTARAPGPFVVHSAIRTDVTAPAMKELIDELARIHQPLAPAELDKARALLGNNLVEGFSEGGATVELIGDLALHDLPLDGWSKQVAALAALTPASVAKASTTLVAPSEELTAVVVGDLAKIEAPLRALKIWKTVEHRDVDGKLLP